MTTGVPVSTPANVFRRLQIHLLGNPRATAADELIDAFASPRVRSIVAYLVLQRGSAIPRQRLATEFWPESSDSQARTNLRNLLHAVRHAHALLDDAIEVTPTTLQWRDADWISVDVDAFVDAADEAIGWDPDDVDGLVERCREALGRYPGDLLPDDSDGWLTPIRDDLTERHTAVLRLLATALIDAARAMEAVSVTRLLVRERPLDETAHRLNIEAHAAAGDRSGAVRAYHECVALLDRELGVAPDVDTRRRFEELVERSEAALPDQRPAMSATSGLVGRAREWSQLEGAWAAAATHGARLVVVEGEPGIGKSRLTEEFAAWCRAEGAVVATARSYLAEGELGFAIIASWLRSDGLTAAIRQLDDDDRGQLARLLPELGPVVASRDLDESERRRRLFDAVVRALGDTVGGPTLLVADDIQWGDRASHELIHYLVRQRPSAPILVVVAARTEDVDVTHPLTDLRNSLATTERCMDVQLGPLTRSDTAELGGTLVGRTLGDEAADDLFAESEGVPLFVVETVRSGWDGSGSPAGASPLLRAVIEARLRVLTTEASEVAAAAALIGRPFAPDLARAVVDLDDRSLARALDELWRRNILRESGADSYDFSHARIREVVDAHLTPATRRTMHAALAEALAATHPEGLDHEIAAHFEAAGRPDEAMTWLQRAIDRAQQMYAYSDAIRLGERAQALIPRLAPDLRHGRELELLSGLPLALAGIDGYGTDRMSHVHERAADIAESLGVDLDPAFVRSMVMSSLCRDEFGAAGEIARRLHDHAVSTGDEGLRLESRYLLGITSFWAADLESARVHFETVSDEFDPEVRERHHARFGHDPQVVCVSRLANTTWFLGDDGAALASAAKALEMAEQVGHPLSRDTAMIFACLLAVDLGDHDLLRDLTDRFLASDLESVPHQIKREALLGYVDVLDGRYAPGIERTRRALEECGGRNFYPGFQQTIARLLVAAYTLADEPHGGLAVTSRALGMGGTQVWTAEYHRMRARFLHDTGAPAAEVIAELDRATSVARSQGAHGHLRRVLGAREQLTKRS